MISNSHGLHNAHGKQFPLGCHVAKPEQLYAFRSTRTKCIGATPSVDVVQD